MSRRTTSDKVLHNTAVNVAKKSSGANTSGGAVTHACKSTIKNELMPNYQLAEELHKLIIRKFEKPKVYPSFKDHNWG